MSYKLEPRGFKEMQALFMLAPHIVSKHLLASMKKSVITVENNVKPLTPVGVSSMLRNSISSEVIGSGSNIVGRIGSTLKNEKYPAVMEFGRKPGVGVPPGKLERWVHLVLRVPTKDAPKVARKVAGAISRKGIKGHFFMKEGWKKSVVKVNGFFREGLKAIIGDLIHGG